MCNGPSCGAYTGCVGDHCDDFFRVPSGNGQVELGIGTDARQVELLPPPVPIVACDDAEDAPTTVCPKDTPPETTAERATYLVTSLQEGTLMTCEVAVSSRDGKLYYEQDPCKGVDGYGDVLEADLCEEANKQFSVASERPWLSMNALRYNLHRGSGDTGSRQGEAVKYEISVDDPEKFCRDYAAQQAISDALAARAEVSGAKGRVDGCTVQTCNEERRLKKGNVDLTFTVLMPKGQASIGRKKLAAIDLTTLQDDANFHQNSFRLTLRSMRTPQSIRNSPPSAGQGHDSQPGSVGEAMQQGRFDAIGNMLGITRLNTQGGQQAIQGTSSLSLGALLGATLLIATLFVLRQHRRGRRPGDHLLAGEVQAEE